MWRRAKQDLWARQTSRLHGIRAAYFVLGGCVAAAPFCLNCVLQSGGATRPEMKSPPPRSRPAPPRPVRSPPGTARSSPTASGSAPPAPIMEVVVADPEPARLFLADLGKPAEPLAVQGNPPRVTA